MDGVFLDRKMVVVPHFKRLHEMVAKEKNMFAEEGLEVEFRTDVMEGTTNAPDFPRVVGEELAEDKVPSMSAACNWGVCVSAGAGRGKLVNDVYFRTENSVFVPSDSKIQTAKDLEGVPVGVGELSGSHFSGIEILEANMPRDRVKVELIGGPATRLRKLMSGEAEAANLLPPYIYIARQLGLREVLSGHYKTLLWAGNTVTREETEAYVRAMKRAQEEIDRAPQAYLHYWNDLMPVDFRGLVDVSKFGQGEVLVAEPYTEDEYKKVFAWMKERGLTGRMMDNGYERLIVR